MTYSKYFYPQQTKIPVPITVAVVLLIIFFLARLFSSSPLSSRAGKKTISNLMHTNPTTNQLGIFWQTDNPETGWVVYGKNSKELNEVASDERDLQDKKSTYLNHFVLLKNLDPGTEYFYKIVSNNVLAEANGNNSSFSFKTPVNQATAVNSNPAYGKIIEENGQAVESALVIVTFEQAYSLITLSKTTGEWLVPLNMILNKGNLKQLTVNPKDKLTIEVLSEQNKKSKIITDVEHLSPLPQTVVLGKDYDFLKEDQVLAATADRNSGYGDIDIIYPKESAIIPGGRPLLKGTALAGNEVQLSIVRGKNYNFTTRADKAGNWTVVLKETLTPGSYTLNVSSKGTNGKTVELVRKFSIAKSGEQVLAAATPESTITDTPFPTPTEQEIVFLSPTVYEFPTASESPTLAVSPPTSGNNIVPIGVISVSLVILGLGVLLAF